jgi:hypothetical protein
VISKYKEEYKCQGVPKRLSRKQCSFYNKNRLIYVVEPVIGVVDYDANNSPETVSVI